MARQHIAFVSKGQTTVGALRRRRIFLAVAILVVVLLDLFAAFTVHSQLDRFNDDRVRSVLDAALSTRVAATQSWFSVRTGRLGVIVAGSEFRSRSLALVKEPHREELATSLRALNDTLSMAGRRIPWAVVTPDGSVLVDQAQLGSRLPEALRARLKDVGAAEILLPFEVAPGEVRGFGVAPIGDAREAFFVVPIELQELLAGPFANDPVLETGEIYAFDSEGLMLSQSRFVEELRRQHQVSIARSTTVMQLPVREGAKSSGQFTLPVREALAGRNGSDFEGYPDYRGTLVQGTWHWFPKYRMGLVAELDDAEARAPIIIIRPLLMGLVVAMGMVLISLAWMWIRLRAAEERARKLLTETRRLGQYELGRKLGEGGMGVVYEGRHALLHRPAAIKLMQAGSLTEDQVTRFDREAQATASLTHPNTVSVYDFGRARDGTWYYVMELLQGADLDRLVRRAGPLDEARVVHVLRQMCGSLGEAHLHGLVHRDVKPSNVHLSSRVGVQDTVKVLDFGLVRGFEGSSSKSHGIVGTPLYMAPEMFDGAHHASAASDLYAVGAVAYWLLTGETLYDESHGIAELLVDHRSRSPVPVSERLGRPVHATLLRFIEACLDKRPEARPVTMAAACALLDDYPTPWRATEASAWWQAHGAALVVVDELGRADTVVRPSEDDDQATAA